MDSDNVPISFSDIPSWMLTKWQAVADLLSELIHVPATLIMKTENEFMEVFVSSASEGNPYHAGEKDSWEGLYCQRVILSQKELLVPDATEDPLWDHNPDLKLGMVAYLGFPINFPDGKPFGTLCVLDREKRSFTSLHEKLLLQFVGIIELDLALFQSYRVMATNLSNQNALLLENQESLLRNEQAANTWEEQKVDGLRNLIHEIKTPVSSVLGFSELLQDQNFTEEKRKTYAGIINKSARLILTLVEELSRSQHNFSTEVGTHSEHFPVNHFLFDIQAVFKPQALARDLDLVVSQILPQEHNYIETDREKLTQIMNNLVVNALKFTSRGSVTIGCRLLGNDLEFFVTDTGIGIDHDLMDVLFERYRQGKNVAENYGGSGLGLAISSELACLLKGNIRVESEPGTGSSFYLTIPQNSRSV